MLDNEKFIAAQAVMKSLIAIIPNCKENANTEDWLKNSFKTCMKIMEDYATIPEEEEWINMEIPITKEFWNQTPQNQTKWITEWGKPMPVLNKVGRKEWFIFVQRKNMDKFKKVMSDFESSVSAKQNQ